MENKRVFASQLLQGLAGVHEKGLAHCDIKPANIHMMDKGKEETANLADFDLATSQRISPSTNTMNYFLNQAQKAKSTLFGK
jgi:serine/threonine protein kinase